MAFIRGSKATLTLNTVNLSAFINQFSISRESQLINIETLGDTFAEVQQNLKSSTITFSGFFDTAASNTPDTVISAALLADTNMKLVITYVGSTTRTITWDPAGSPVSGVRVASYEVTAATDNLMAFSCTLQAVGPGSPVIS